jgi:integrase
MSPDETKLLLAVARNLKVRVLLSLGYGCCLRAGEVIRLRVKHIDSAQKIIRVEQSKGLPPAKAGGRKDRNVMLPPELLDLLRTLVFSIAVSAIVVGIARACAPIAPTSRAAAPRSGGLAPGRI